MSEIGEIFNSLPARFVPNGIQQKRVFYFSLDEDEKWHVTLSAEECTVGAGHAESADCVLKGSKALFLEIWNGRYTPSAMDFITGKIKSNNPLLLKEFMAAFGKRV
ncbi:MAG: SCP2 sterol-binding domain-containing protein [Vicinamibacteria bacterium]